MSTPKKLRLGPLPKTENIKLTFGCPVTLKADLDRYAALHAQTYGEAVDATGASSETALTKPVTTIGHRMANARLKGCAFNFCGKERMR